MVYSKIQKHWINDVNSIKFDIKGEKISIVWLLATTLKFSNNSNYEHIRAGLKLHNILKLLKKLQKSKVLTSKNCIPLRKEYQVKGKLLIIYSH